MKQRALLGMIVITIFLTGNAFAQTATVSINQLADTLVISGEVFAGTEGTLAISIAKTEFGFATGVLSAYLESGVEFFVDPASGSLPDTITTVTTILRFTPDADGLFADNLIIEFDDGTFAIPVVGKGLFFGDVNESGSITPDDAVEVLRDVVGKTPVVIFNPAAADVTGNGSVTAFDASYILRKITGIVTEFPVLAPKVGIASAEVYIDKENVKNADDNVIVPIFIDAKGVYSLNGVIRFDQEYLQYDGLYVDIDNIELMRNMFLEENVDDNSVKIAMASMIEMDLKSDVLFLKFKKVGPGIPRGTITIEQFLVNEYIADVSGINLESKPILPYDYFVEQNFPNPFNSETIIRYGLPKTDRVSIKIYNITAQEIRTLVDEEKPAGNHEIRWDGKNNAGLDVATGMYLYIFRSTSGFSRTMRMVIVK